ncbi:SRPBCC family protein [Kitasatospora sp. NPDC054795]
MHEADLTPITCVYRQTRHLPRPAEEHFRVTEYDPPSLLTVDGDFGPFSGIATYRLTAIDQRTTRLVNSFHLTASGAAKVVAALAGSQIKRAVAKNLDVLKNLLETR